MPTQNPDIRWKQRFTNFEKALRLLADAIQLESLSEVERAGLIQFYEMAFELAWKLMKDYLEKEGYTINSPRQAIKQGSDVDLALKGQGITDQVVNALSDLLNEQLPLPYFFDVVPYDHLVSPALVEHIDRVGQVIYGREKSSRNAGP